MKSCYVVQAGLQLAILLPLLPECWDYRYAPPYPAALLFQKENIQIAGNQDKSQKKFFLNNKL
jgi:hypothetical protein